MTSESPQGDINVTDPEIVKRQEAVCQSLFSDIWADNEFEMKDAIKAMFFMLYNIKSTTDSTNTQMSRVSKIEQATQSNKESINDLQLRLNELECEQVKNQIILRKVPLHPSVSTGGEETQEQTVQQMNDLLQDMKITFQAKDYPEVFRVPLSKTQNKRKVIPNIFVKFPNFTGLSDFYRNLSYLQESENYKDIRVDKFVPQSMLEDYNNAQAKAYILRHQTPKKKTFIKLAKGKVILKYKTPSGTTWKEASFEPESNESTETPTASGSGTQVGNASKKRKTPTHN